MSFDLGQVKQKKLSSSYDTSGIAKRYAKRIRDEEELKRQQQLIDAEYNKTLAENTKRGALDRVADGLSILQYPAFGAITEGFNGWHENDGLVDKTVGAVSGVFEGAWEGLKSANPFGDDYTKGEYQFGDVADSGAFQATAFMNPLIAPAKIQGIVGSIIDPSNKEAQQKKNLGKRGAWSAWQPEGIVGKFEKGASNFLGNALLDPANLIGGSAVKTVAKGTGKRLGKEAIQSIGKEAIEQSAKAQGLSISKEVAERYAKKIDKARGVVDTSEKLSIAGKELTKTTDFLRTLGDNTIAPLFNTTGDFVKSTKPVEFFDTLFETRKLAKNDVDGFVKMMAWKDSGVEKALMRVGFNAEMVEKANKVFMNVSPEERKSIVDVLEGGKKIIDTTLEKPDEFHQSLFKDFMDMRLQFMEDGGVGEGFASKTMKEVFDKTKDPFERMATPKTKPEEVVFRHFLDPKGEMKDLPYETIYNNFMDNMTVTTKRFDEKLVEPSDMIEALVAKTQRTPINEMQKRTGIFVNQNNLEKYSVLFKQPKSLSKIIGMSAKQKLTYLNAILFDGKPVLNIDVKAKGADGKLNGIINIIKNNPTEGELLRNLEDIATGNNGSYIDIILDDESLIRNIKETGNVPEDIMEAIASNKGKQIRLYDGNTRTLVADNLSGSFTNRTDAYADSLRIRKEAKLSAIKEAVSNVKQGGTLADTDVSELLNRQRSQILTQLRKEMPAEYEYFFNTNNTGAIDAIIRRTDTDILNVIRDDIARYGKNLTPEQYDELLDNLYTEELRKQSLLTLYNTIAKEGIQSPSVMKDVMKLDILLPSSKQNGLKGVYEYEFFNTQTSEYIGYTYDPYTGKFDGRPVAILENTLASAGTDVSTQIDHIQEVLNASLTDKVLTDRFKEYIDLQQMKNGDNYVVEGGELFLKRTESRLDLDNVDLSKDAKETIEFITNKFAEFAGREVGAKKLKTQLTQYVPHILNPNLKNNPSIMEKLKTQNPELYRQVLMYSGDKFNKHGIGRSSSLENAVKEVLTSKYANDPLQYVGEGKTIAEVNEALKPMLEKAGFDGDFFINDIYDAFIQRAINHGEVVYAERFVDDTVEQFAKWVDTSLIKDKGKYYVTQKDLRGCFTDHVTGGILEEERQWTLLQEMGFDPKKRYNKMLIEVDGKQLKTMREAVKKRNPDLNLGGYEMPKYVVQNLNKVGHIQQLDDAHGLLKFIDKFTNLWKQTATVINPGFHMRNYASNKWQNYLAVGTDVFNKQVRNMTKDIISGKQGILITKNNKRITFSEIRNQLQARDILSRIDFDVAKQSNQTGKLFGDELNKGNGGLLQAGLSMVKEPLGINDVTMFNKVDPTDTQNFFGFNVGRKYGQKIEDFDRSLNFIANIRNDLDWNDAHEMVDKFLFDYSDLTSFEVNVMKRAFPFYTWLRKNAPLQMEMLLSEPGKYAWAFRSIDNLQEEGDTDHLPEFMSDWVRLPIEFKNKDIYINPSMPFQDVTKTMSFGMKDAIGMLNPLAKIPLELGTNHNTFFDAPIITSTEPDKAWGQVGNYLGNSLLGGWNTLDSAIGGVTSGDLETAIEKAGSVATGIRAKFYDPEKTKEDAIYRAIRAMEEKYKEPSKKEKAFNQSFEEYKQTKLNKYGY